MATAKTGRPDLLSEKR